MNKFQVNLTEHAADDLQGISKETRKKIYNDLKALESAPFPFGTRIKRLRGFRPPIYRMRSGDFRVLYHIRENNVTILRVIDRKLLERLLKRIKASLKH